VAKPGEGRGVKSNRRLTPVNFRRTLALMAGRKKKLSPEQMREYIHSLRGSLKQKPAKNP
jgi:hypothetical protein